MPLRLSRPSIGALASVALLGLSGSCISRPPCEAGYELGSVWADTPQEASAVLAMLAELRPAVEAVLGDGAQDAVDVWMRDIQGEHVTRAGYTHRRDGERTIVHLQAASDTTRTTLAHELVHALYPERMGLFPPLVEEGIASWVAERVAAAAGEDARATKLVHIAAYFDAMRLSLEVHDGQGEEGTRALGLELGLASEPDPSPPEELFADWERGDFLERIESAGSLRSSRHYALAELCVEQLVERQGLGALDQLAERATAGGVDCVPWPWIAEAAGLEQRKDWLDAAWERLTAADVRWLAETQPDLIVPPLAWVCTSILGPMHPQLHGIQLLQATQARLVFASGEPLLLAELEPLVAALADPSTSSDPPSAHFR
jgi:hypothetical protein